MILLFGVSGRSVNRKTSACVWWAVLCTLYPRYQEQVPSVADRHCLPCYRNRKNVVSMSHLCRRSSIYSATFL